MKMINVAGLELSELALGAGKRGPVENDAAAFAVMDRYIELGGNCLDTARMYAGGQSDEALGRWLKSRGLRNQVILVTKGCFPADSKAMHNVFCSESILHSLSSMHIVISYMGAI